MRALLSSLLFACTVLGAKNVTFQGTPGVAGIINVQGQRRGEVLWHKIGQSIKPWEFSDLRVRSLFEILKVNVTSGNTANIKVVFNGGTNAAWLDPPDITHPLYQSLYRKYCASWFGGGSSVNCENVILPRFGIWAPFGTTQVAVTQDAKDSFDYSITFRRDYDRLRAIRMVIGMFFFLFGGFFSHSQPVHYLVGTALGSVGFVVVLMFVAMRFVPGNKPAFAMVGAASATFMAWLYNTLHDALTAHVAQYLPYYMGLMAVGGFAGFAYAYKHPLDANSRFLCLLLIRVASAGLILFEGPTSYLVAIAVIAMMSILLLFRRCGCSLGLCFGKLCTKRPDEPLPLEPETDLPGEEEEEEEVLRSEEDLYPISHARSRPPSPVLSHSAPVSAERFSTVLRPQEKNTQSYNRAPSSSTSSSAPFSSSLPANSGFTRAQSIPAPSYPLYTPSDKTFDFKDVPLPPVASQTPDFVLPPVGQTFHANLSPSSADPEELLQTLEAKVVEFETIIKDVRKRLPKRPRGDDEPLQKARRVEK